MMRLNSKVALSKLMSGRIHKVTIIRCATINQVASPFNALAPRAAVGITDVTHHALVAIVSIPSNPAEIEIQTDGCKKG